VARESNDIIRRVFSPVAEADPMNKKPSLQLQPIGIIHSPHKDSAQPPYQGYRSEEVSQIEVFKEFEEGLRDIEGFSHIIVIFWFHKSRGYHLLVRPPWDEILHGLFATRSPHRPCPLGLTVAELISRKDNVLEVRGLDAIDGTPLLDIKPYIPEIDERSTVRLGWLQDKLGKERI
jgi:tRNA-Thr(GGU) m(6)t(6)A37 methyltransferase TsaA